MPNIIIGYAVAWSIMDLLWGNAMCKMGSTYLVEEGAGSRCSIVCHRSFSNVGSGVYCVKVWKKGAIVCSSLACSDALP